MKTLLALALFPIAAALLRTKDDSVLLERLRARDPDAMGELEIESAGYRLERRATDRPGELRIRSADERITSAAHRGDRRAGHRIGGLSIESAELRHR